MSDKSDRLIVDVYKTYRDNRIGEWNITVRIESLFEDAIAVARKLLEAAPEASHAKLQVHWDFPVMSRMESGQSDAPKLTQAEIDAEKPYQYRRWLIEQLEASFAAEFERSKRK